MPRLKTSSRKRRLKLMKRKSRLLMLDEFWDIQLSPLERREKYHQQHIHYISFEASLSPRDRRNKLKLAKRRYERFIEHYGQRLEEERAVWSNRRKEFTKTLERTVAASRSRHSTVVVGYQSASDFAQASGVQRLR